MHLFFIFQEVADWPTAVVSAFRNQMRCNPSWATATGFIWRIAFASVVRYKTDSRESAMKTT